MRLSNVSHPLVFSSIVRIYTSYASCLMRKKMRFDSSMYLAPSAPHLPELELSMRIVLFLILSVLVANMKKTTLRGGQSRSWSAKQGEKKKKKSLATHPPFPPPTLLVRRKQNKIT